MSKKLLERELAFNIPGARKLIDEKIPEGIVLVRVLGGPGEFKCHLRFSLDESVGVFFERRVVADLAADTMGAGFFVRRGAAGETQRGREGEVGDEAANDEVEDHGAPALRAASIASASS